MSLMHKVLPDEMNILDQFTYLESLTLEKLSNGFGWAMYDVKSKHGHEQDAQGYTCVHSIYQSVSNGWVNVAILEPCELPVNKSGVVDLVQQKLFNETLDRVYAGIRRDRMIEARFMHLSESNRYVINRKAINEYLAMRAAARKCYDSGKLVVDELLKSIKENGKVRTLERLVELGNVPDYYYIVSQYAEQK